MFSRSEWGPGLRRGRGRRSASVRSRRGPGASSASLDPGAVPARTKWVAAARRRLIPAKRHASRLRLAFHAGAVEASDPASELIEACADLVQWLHDTPAPPGLEKSGGRAWGCGRRVPQRSIRVSQSGKWRRRPAPGPLRGVRVDAGARRTPPRSLPDTGQGRPLGVTFARPGPHSPAAL